MVIDEIWFRLKDGRRALLRSPQEGDEQGMLDYLEKSAGETDFLLRYPEECSGRYSLERERELFREINESPDRVMLVCIVDGRVAGDCDIAFNNRIKTRHRAVIGIAILREYWNQGIGTRMFEELIRLAENREGLLQMELEIIEGNARARHLYEKMGFRVAGIHPNAIRLKDGTLLNEYLMIREMKR